MVFCIHPDDIEDPRHPPPHAVAQYLQHESLFEESILCQGMHTQYITGFELMSDLKKLANKDSAEAKADLVFADSLLSSSSSKPATSLVPENQCGVGIVLREGATGQPVVTEIEKGGPAEGSFVVVKNDVLHSVDGVAVRGMDLASVNGLLLGHAGSTVILELRRPVGWMQFAYARGKDDANGMGGNPTMMPITVSLERSQVDLSETAPRWKPSRPSVESFGEPDTVRRSMRGPSPDMTMHEFKSSFGKMAQLAQGHDSDPSLIGSSRPSSDEVSATEEVPLPAPASARLEQRTQQGRS